MWVFGHETFIIINISEVAVKKCFNKTIEVSKSENNVSNFFAISLTLIS